MIGIDVGGTKLLAAVVDRANGEVVAWRRVATEAAEGGHAVLDRCVTLADELRRQCDLPAAPAIGIAICETVDVSGRPTSAATVDWLGLDVDAAFAAAGFAGRVVVESDVRAAAIAESRFGAGADVEQFVYVGVGTGIAFTSIVGGVPHRGAHGNAILLGVPPVERVASGPAIARQAGTATAEAAFDDPAGVHVTLQAARQLGLALAWLNNAFDPELIVIGGGLGLRDDFRQAAVSAMQAAVVDAGGVVPDVRPAALGEYSAAIGAVALAG
jgi:predicted NBD/HSP70 family sugar kinase